MVLPAAGQDGAWRLKSAVVQGESGEGAHAHGDLPKLALNRVLEEVSPASLSAMACFCARLRLVPLV
jgi:hypothetical protein